MWYLDKFKDVVKHEVLPREKEPEKIIKVLRTDNGGEFCGNEFE